MLVANRFAILHPANKIRHQPKADASFKIGMTGFEPDY